MLTQSTNTIAAKSPRTQEDQLSRAPVLEPIQAAPPSRSGEPKQFKALLIRQTRLCKRLDVSPSTLHRWREIDKTFPKPLKEGPHRQAANFYVISEVERWLSEQTDNGILAPKASSNEHARPYLIKQKRLQQALDLSRTGLYELISSDPTFPSSTKMGESQQAQAFYVLTEIESWLQAKIEARDKALCSQEAN